MTALSKANIKAIAKAVGGKVVVATTTIDVYFQDAWHADKNTPTLKLPVVFSGKLEAVEAWAKKNDFKRIIDRESLYGVYYTDTHGNAYLLG